MSRAMKFDELMELIDTNLIEGAEAVRRYCDGTRARTYQGSVACFKIARILKANSALRSAFYNNPFWERGYVKNPNNLLLHVHQYSYNARSGCDGRLAEDHARAEQPCFDDGVTTPEKLMELLTEGGGFSGLKKASGKGHVDTGGGGVTSTAGPVGGDDASNERPSAQAATKAVVSEEKREVLAKSRKRNILWSPKEVSERLLVDMTPEELEGFLPENSSVDDEVSLTLKRCADASNGMAVWRAIHIGPVT